ncbi:MAG: universal stress protein [Candidatus Methanomethyliaceae archaeon]|nr:universal stress protein [Candidatus Methanomethyliaceae archaeon]MDW7971122.1 universal stress protein [Nitrososphaerota archaeon]
MSKFSDYVKLCKKQPYSKIGVAIDRSMRSAAALCRAIMLSKIFNSNLYIIHVIPKKLPYATSQRIEMSYESYEVLLKEGKEELEFAKSVAEEAGVKAECILLEGDPAEEILNFVENNKIDLLIVGKKEKGDFIKNLGSVSESIIRRSRIPVLVEI